MKRVAFLIGAVLSMTAFFAAAADMAAHAIDPSLSVIAGLDEVLFTIVPERFDTFASIAPAFIMHGLALPGWLSFGVPGLALIIYGHERTEGSDQDDALFLFDELTRQAHEDGYTDGGDEEDSTSFSAYTPADKHYADDDVADDLIATDGPGQNPGAEPTGKTRTDTD